MNIDGNNILEPITEKQRFIHSIIFPSLFIIILWIIKIFEYEFNWDLHTLGVYPRKIFGLIGILTSPFIHGSFEHLFNNSTALFVLTLAVFYFYRPIQYKVFFLVFIISGIWVWFGGRSAYHIGASGIVYGLASFIFFSGVIRNDVRLMSISFIVVFLYGSMVWGIFPIKHTISWESHMLGSIAGLILAVYYRRYGPQPIKFSWEVDDEIIENEISEDSDPESLDNTMQDKSQTAE
ncbi:rhomboid family intramembrane serine protease [Bacteroidota bacterium]